jgi:PleD family two-component response regulator
MRTIYFAHDQQESPAVRKNFLELAGYAVRLCRNHRELMMALKEAPPDLVLIDVLLEGKNGFEETVEVGQRFPQRNFPILLCSNIYRLRPFREEALKCGAQDFLLLPMPPDEFLRRVNQAIAYFVPPEAARDSARA